MIFVFGAILQYIEIGKIGTAHVSKTSFASQYHNSIAGKAALQSLVAAKAEAKVNLIGKMGDDELAKHILLRLRTHGVTTSGVAKIEKMQTGTSILFKEENKTITALSASALASAEQIPEDVLNERSIILLQNELGAFQNSILLERARKVGATAILNFSPKTEISNDDLQKLNYVIAPKENKSALGDFKKYNHLTVIILNPDGSCELHIRGGAARNIPAIKTAQLNWAHPEGAEDTFCGIFAAGLLDKLPFEQIILRALIAAALTASKPGAYDAVPYLADIEEQLKLMSGA